MPRIFLSHCSKDKKTVRKIEKSLQNSLIKTWIDEIDIPGGGRLNGKILRGIKDCDYFAPIITNNYINSDWCARELEGAIALERKKEIKIFPILLEERSELTFGDELEELKDSFEINIFDRIRYVEFDSHDFDQSIKNLLSDFWGNECVKFEPLKSIVLNNEESILIEFSITNTKDGLVSNFIETWNFNIKEFVADTTSDGKPLKFDLPIVFSGRAPGWLLMYLAIPFNNLRTVYVYNNQTKDYICVCTPLNSDHVLGSAVKTV